MEEETNFSEDLMNFIREGASLDPRYWVLQIGCYKDVLSSTLVSDDKPNVLFDSSRLLFVTHIFQIVVAGAEQLSLFSIKEKSEILEVLAKGMAEHGKALDMLGEINYAEAMKRVIKWYMKPTNDYPDMGDLV